jgi:hypothetical protein
LEAPLSEIPVVEVEHMIWSLLKEPQELVGMAGDHFGGFSACFFYWNMGLSENSVPNISNG